MKPNFLRCFIEGMASSFDLFGVLPSSIPPKMKIKNPEEAAQADARTIAEIWDRVMSDTYIDKDGRMVFTEQYHKRRGYCCNSGCRHCPYKKK